MYSKICIYFTRVKWHFTAGKVDLLSKNCLSDRLGCKLKVSLGTLNFTVPFSVPVAWFPFRQCNLQSVGHALRSRHLGSIIHFVYVQEALRVLYFASTFDISLLIKPEGEEKLLVSKVRAFRAASPQVKPIFSPVLLTRREKCTVSIQSHIVKANKLDWNHDDEWWRIF